MILQVPCNSSHSVILPICEGEKQHWAAAACMPDIAEWGHDSALPSALPCGLRAEGAAMAPPPRGGNTLPASLHCPTSCPQCPLPSTGRLDGSMCHSCCPPAKAAPSICLWSGRRDLLGKVFLQGVNRKPGVQHCNWKYLISPVFKIGLLPGRP